MCRESNAEKEPATALVTIKLNNVMAILRRCCNHPYLIEYPMDNGVLRIDENIVSCCGKMMLLDKMLARLKDDGHKVPAFSG